MSQPAGLRLLALGDSYTIGTGASSEAASWPALVGRRLAESARRTVTVTNPAVNGFTTEDLIARELPLLARVRPDYVTVLIGANDIVQGRDEADYRRSLLTILGAVAASGAAPDRVAGISIPDWSVSPAAWQFGTPVEIHARIDAFNGIAREEGGRLGFGWVDIGDLSRAGVGRAGWLSADRLHPADLQYAAWAGRIWEGVRGRWLAGL